MTTPRNEQETIISYDRELDQWHYYSDVPKHNRKWADLVKNGAQVKINLKEKPPYGAMTKLVEMYRSVPEFKGFEIKQDLGCYNNIIFRWGKVMEARDETD